MEVVASLSQGHTAAAQYGLFTYKSVPVIFEPPCTWLAITQLTLVHLRTVLPLSPGPIPTSSLPRYYSLLNDMQDDSQSMEMIS